MDSLNVQFNVTVLTVPTFITPEEFPSWLQHEAHALQDLAADNSLIIVRLFLDKRIKDVITRKQLDTVMQKITDKYPHIFRMEMMVIDDDLDAEEIEQIQSDTEQGLAELLESVERFQEQRIAKRRLH
jgi:hypothetical protein